MSTIFGVSFIVVTRNEAFGINKCLDSLSRLSLEDCEIICVDSGSSDSTLDVIKGFKEKFRDLHVYQIEGYANSAIARNLGIRRASKEYLFFIDGDVEITEQFVLTAIEAIKSKETDAAFGKLAEFQYEQGFCNIINKVKDRYYVRRREKSYSSGGIFITKKSVVENVGFFDESLVRNQDYDFTLRLTSKYKMLAIDVLMGTHHTVPYHELHRLKGMMFSSQKYLGKVLMKNILTNTRGVLDLLYRKNRGLCFGYFYYILLIYGFIKLPDLKIIFLLIGIMLVDAIHGAMNRSIFWRIWTHYLCPLFVIFGFFAKNEKNNNYRVNTVIF
jgi:glycosyltransferase involved in cell wall biosynthesis